MKNKHLIGDFDFRYNDVLYTVEYDGNWIYDPSYGADADGNRGVGTWLEDYLEMTVFDQQGNKIKDMFVEIQAELLLTDKVWSKILE